ncbi:hypothetical protein CLV43_114230 [Umezawaea tangerina]|uniref:Uncharacterized protein n=1 Tax=Umezawaea tangerina TaxID=84725 RepID=A0A2T0SPG2_9PSEU|nr:hypothetical protein CLV43_114230 [Umezawaea tangerina]
MNPRAVLVIVIGAIALAALVIWWLSRSAGVRRRDFRRLERERNLLATAVQQIEIKADTYRDLDSVLASDVRTILRKLNTDRMDLTR